MKFFALLLILSVSVSAQVRYSPTGFTAPFISTVTNQASAQTYLGISGGSGAPLDGTNVWTGTNRFTDTVIITNAASTLSGNGAGLTNLAAGNVASGSLADARLSSNVPLKDGANTFTGVNTFPASLHSANNIGLRLLWSCPTNINVSSFAVAAVGSVTNAGNFSACTPLATVTVPALLGSNSTLVMVRLTETPAQVSSGGIAVYVGTNTNFVGYASAFFTGTSAARNSGVTALADILSNFNGFTNQLQGTTTVNPNIFGPTNFVDTSSSFTLYIGGFTATSCTNVNIRRLALYEFYSP